MYPSKKYFINGMIALEEYFASERARDITPEEDKMKLNVAISGDRVKIKGSSVEGILKVRTPDYETPGKAMFLVFIPDVGQSYWFRENDLSDNI